MAWVAGLGSAKGKATELPHEGRLRDVRHAPLYEERLVVQAEEEPLVELAEPHDVPASRRGQTASMHHTRFAGVQDAQALAFRRFFAGVLAFCAGVLSFPTPKRRWT